MKETMGQIIKRLRKERGFTQEELAEQVGVTFQAVSKWENDNGMPDISQIIPLATVFNVSTDVLFGRVGTDDNKQVWQLIEQATAFIDETGSAESLYRCYQALHEGLKTYPTNAALLMRRLETGIALAYPENDCYAPKFAEEIYQNCIHEADLIIKYGNNTNNILRARMIMVILHGAYNNPQAAKSHLEHFPWRADMTVHKLSAFISHWEKDYKTQAQQLQTDYMYHVEAMLDDMVDLSECYHALGNLKDAIFVLEQTLTPIDNLAGSNEIHPHLHYRERGDLYALLAKLYLEAGDTPAALEQLSKMVTYDITATTAKAETALSSPLLRDVTHNFYWSPPGAGECLRKKLNDPAFAPLHEHPQFAELLEKANSL